MLSVMYRCRCFVHVGAAHLLCVGHHHVGQFQLVHAQRSAVPAI